MKKVFLKIPQNSQKNTHVGVSFLIKLQISSSNFIKKEIPTQVFFCEFCENFLRMFFIEYIRPAASECVCYFFAFQFVFLLHSFVKFGVSVMLGCRVIKNCQHLCFSYEFLTIFERHKVHFLEKVAKILEDMLS